MRVRVPQSVLAYWAQYGDLSSVATRLVKEVEVQHLPRYVNDPGDPLVHAQVQVADDMYNGLVETFGTQSNAVSLSRVLTHYCYTCYPEQAGWQKVAARATESTLRTQQATRALARARDDLRAAYTHILRHGDVDTAKRVMAVRHTLADIIRRWTDA